MTRDMDLIRQLLLDLEALPMSPETGWSLTGENFEIDGYDAQQINYHLALIREAGFVDDAGHRPGVGIGFRRLTWMGHDFIDTTRDHTVWQRTKEIASRAGGGGFDVLLGIAKEVVKQKIVQLTGGVFGF